MKTLERISQHSFLPSLVRNGSIVLDLGGNRGEFSKGVHQRYGSTVVAVEPCRELAAHLNLSGFEVIEAAVTGEDGTTWFTFDAGQELSGSVLGEGVVGKFLNDVEVIEVPTISLATALKDRTVDLVKVDIEGAELDAFLKASDETLLSVRQFTVEFHDYWYPELSEGTEKVKRRLRGLGFWTMRGTPNNKDVLFVHPDCKPNSFMRFYISFWLRNMHGLGRAFRVLWKRIRPYSQT